MFYWEGKGVPKDETVAFEWLNKAALQDVAGAQTTVGYLYLMGEGVKQDDASALSWLNKAAASVNPLRNATSASCTIVVEV